MKRFFKTLLILSTVFATCACTGDEDLTIKWDDNWKQEESSDPDTPDNPDDPDNTDDPDDPDTPVDNSKPRYLWIDASANFYYYANDKEQIASDLKKIKETGFTDVIVDVRPTEGTVLYKSSVAPEARRLAAWIGSNYKFVERTATWDYLKTFVEEGHKVGLRVNASMNTFVGGYHGYYGLDNEGPIYSGAIPTTWATMVNTKDGIKSSYDLCEGGTVFLCPSNPNVQEYILKIIAEIAAYDVDGLILDRCRYDDYGLQSDFSDYSKTQFEEYFGQTMTNWPSDVFAPGTSELPGTMSVVKKAWLSYRAKVIHDFIVKAAAKAHEVNSDIRFGTYVGAWYSSYYSSGVNWASPKYKTAQHYYWADSDYAQYGYADHLDFIMLGCYAGTDSVYGTTEWTMQGFASRGKSLLCGDTVCAGGPDIGNATGFENGGQEAVIPKTIDACINAADGYFCFDLCHIRMFNYWEAFKKGFDSYLESVN
ncbi:MAG: family 10 glycosylhydrolase [Bacteroidales bacterium]|nr:family 10 glycosylhydrolase [Bacteroidales bacterium]